MGIHNHINILGVRIDNLPKKELQKEILRFLDESSMHQIATVNPEFILEAERDEEFRRILDNADLNIADGIGIRFACWKYGKHLRCRMAGADLMEKIIRIANQQKLTIFLASNEDGLSSWKETRDAIIRLYPNLVIDGDDIDMKNGDYQILSSSCQIVFCNFGQAHQEKFINRQKNDRIRLAVGVGGSFDFLTGKVRRAPYFWRFLGLEWLWRLILQPKRWKRIWNAVFVFPYKIMTK